MLIVEGSSIVMISHHFGLPFAVSCIGISIALAIVGRCVKGVTMVPQIVGMLTLAYAKSIIEYLVPEVSETVFIQTHQYHSATVTSINECSFSRACTHNVQLLFALF